MPKMEKTYVEKEESCPEEIKSMRRWWPTTFAGLLLAGVIGLGGIAWKQNQAAIDTRLDRLEKTMVLKETYDKQQELLSALIAELRDNQKELLKMSAEQQKQLAVIVERMKRRTR